MSTTATCLDPNANRFDDSPDRMAARSAAMAMAPAIFILQVGKRLTSYEPDDFLNLVDDVECERGSRSVWVFKVTSTGKALMSEDMTDDVAAQLWAKREDDYCRQFWEDERMSGNVPSVIAERYEDDMIEWADEADAHRRERVA